MPCAIDESAARRSLSIRRESRREVSAVAKVVSERLGHATVSVTLDTSPHAIPAMQEEAAALITGLVFAK